MKRYIIFLLFFSMFALNNLSAQCPDVYTDINANNSVCGVYGDANGNSNWSWEITDKTNPNYCNNWYARTSSIATKLTAMGSPFVDASIGALDLISQNNDFTKAKGWELVRRDFGCSHVTAYPYFMLYNRYSGLMRIFVYQPETQQQYSGILVQITPTKSPWPATTSFGDELMAAPDKYLSSNQSGEYGKMVIAVGEPGGGSRWSLVELNVALDPNIENALYTGTGIQMTIYGVLTFDMKATIKGRSVSSSDPKVYNFNYRPSAQNAPTTSDGGQTFSFKAAGEKFIKYSKGITDVRDKVNKQATAILNNLSNVNVLETSPLGKIKKVAFAVQTLTATDSDLSKLLGNASAFGTTAGLVLKFVGTMIGLFGGSTTSSTPAPMPTYTNYDLVLNGTITAKNVQQTYILRVPGTLQNDNSNAPYYKCPEGIFNLKNTPQADTVVYRRLYEWQFYGDGYGSQTRAFFTAYRIRNDIPVVYNDGTGLELVSAEGALVGEILPDVVTGNPTYNLFMEHIITNPNTNTAQYRYNFMLSDIQSGRLEVVNYDTEKGLHTFQTPYVKLECLKGLSLNAYSTTKVYLRIKAILKRKNDPANTPIIYVKDYALDLFQGSIDSYLRYKYGNYSSENQFPPFANYSELPTYISDVTVSNVTYTGTNVVKADNSITTQNNVIVASTGNVTFRAGAAIILKPGFVVQSGGLFKADINNYGFSLTCGTPLIDAYQYGGNCYNTTVTALRNRPVNSEEYKEISVYPTLTSGLVNISGSDLPNSRIMVVDANGNFIQPLINGKGTTSQQLHLESLPDGLYFINIYTGDKLITRKVVVHK